MAKRDILKEAIADAKAVKETAIANAKAALEEAFTPQLKSMLAAKLEEMELDEEKEEKMEEGYSNKDGLKDDSPTEKKSERGRFNASGDVSEGDDKDSMEEEINLDEILAEIEGELNEEENITEDEKTKAEEEGYLDGMKDEKEDMEDKEDDEIELDDMTDDDLKDFIEDVIADMVASGELEAGENFEEEGEEEIVDDTEVDVEISEAKKKDKEDDKEEVKESTDGDEVMTSDPATGAAAGMVELEKLFKQAGGNIQRLGKAGMEKLKDLFDFSEPASPLQQKLRKAGTGKPQGFQNRYEEDGVEEAKKDKELKEAYDTIESLRSDLNEVNLLNAKLLYTNKIFKAKTLTESQKVKVLVAFDKANTVKETKLVFETLNEGLKAKKKSPITESLGAASRVSGNVNTKKPIIETDPMVERFKKLAGLK